jgi:uncharacterized repeat protein (TIGR01451 family)
MQVRLLWILMLIGLTTKSQVTGVQWQKPFGGTDWDGFLFMEKTNDSGFITLAASTSTNGDFSDHTNNYILVKINKNGYTEWKRSIFPRSLSFTFKTAMVLPNDDLLVVGENSGTGSHGGNDIWIAKYDNLGNLLWQNFYGGTATDVFGSIIRDGDGNFVIAASVPNATGNITGNFHGTTDVWIFKINQSGTILWNQCYGGSNAEFRDRLSIQVLGSDYIVITETLSNNGDVIGHHGSWDIWTFKINSIGILQWQITLGGAEIDYSTSLVEGENGGYYILGNSQSFAIPNFHPNVNWDFDFYVAKISSNGVFEWHKCFGGYYSDGSSAIFSEEDGGAVIFGAVSTVSGNTGDIIALSGSNSEIWSLKINSLGTIIWQRCLGGNSEESLFKVLEEKYDDNNNLLPDSLRSYAILAKTKSWTRDVIGYHPNPPVCCTFQYSDIWFTKMKKSDRTLLWSRCIGGRYSEYPKAFVKINSKEYLLACDTDSPDGDVVGFHFNGNDYNDAWLVKFGPTNTIKGNVYIDMNSNGVKDLNEKPFSNARVKSEKANDTKISVSSGGVFHNDADTGTYVSTISFSLPYYVSSLSSRQSTFTQYNQKDSFAFPLVPSGIHYDLKVFAVPTNSARAGGPSQYILFCTNSGTQTITNSTLKFIKDSRINWGNMIPVANSIVNDSAWWNITTIAPFDTLRFNVLFSFDFPPILNIGDNVTSIVQFNSSQPDETPSDNADTLTQIIVGSYDPNDKNENHAGLIAYKSIGAGDELSYTIRFQNTGSDTAFRVIIRDTLDTKLIWSSLQMITASHNYQLTIENGNQLIWDFKNIKLVDSVHNEPASHGFISFKIKPAPSIQPGDTIRNSASIYFDFNPPVKTNTNETVVWLDDVTVCAEGTSFIPAYKTGSTYQWQVDDGNGFVNINNSSVYIGVTNDTLRLISPPTSWYGYKYRCVINNLPGILYSPVFTLKFQSLWAGNIDVSWQNPANWNCGIVPDDYTDVIILQNVPNFPELSTNGSCRSLLLQNSATLLIKPGARLDVKSGN